MHVFNVNNSKMNQLSIDHFIKSRIYYNAFFLCFISYLKNKDTEIRSRRTLEKLCTLKHNRRTGVFYYEKEVSNIAKYIYIGWIVVGDSSNNVLKR
jgi:hypothetical protein